jgi:tRNA(fMet)-specific endonuclease VapC
MNLLFDTNIILAIARTKNPSKLIKFLNPEDKQIYILVVNVAEAQCIAFQNNWGKSKIVAMDYFFNQVRVIEITDMLVPTYINIDSFSQCRNPNFSIFEHETPRNMGKNDLWIASTASLLNLKLITTDSDFDHLSNIFINLQKITPNALQEQFVI